VIDDIPIGVGLNRNLGSPTAPREAVEAELDRLITRRHDAEWRIELPGQYSQHGGLGTALDTLAT
jgi:hypothetical protein